MSCRLSPDDDNDHNNNNKTTPIIHFPRFYSAQFVAGGVGHVLLQDRQRRGVNHHRSPRYGRRRLQMHRHQRGGNRRSHHQAQGKSTWRMSKINTIQYGTLHNARSVEASRYAGSMWHNQVKSSSIHETVGPNAAEMRGSDGQLDQQASYRRTDRQTD